VGVQRLLFLGSSCIYPKLAPQPMRERDLLTGPLEPTNRPYALAKIAGIEMCWSYNRQYGTRFLAAMPTNLYGPGDNYHPTHSHVIPACCASFTRPASRATPASPSGAAARRARVSLQRRHGRRLRLPDEPARRAAPSTGVPATLIRTRFSDEVISELLAWQWWDLSDETLTALAKDFCASGTQRAQEINLLQKLASQLGSRPSMSASQDTARP
jgi:hypothetical protein